VLLHLITLVDVFELFVQVLKFLVEIGTDSITVEENALRSLDEMKLNVVGHFLSVGVRRNGTVVANDLLQIHGSNESQSVKTANHTSNSSGGIVNSVK
jgi:hypothetical protein